MGGKIASVDFSPMREDDKRAKAVAAVYALDNTAVANEYSGGGRAALSWSMMAMVNAGSIGMTVLRDSDPPCRQPIG